MVLGTAKVSVMSCDLVELVYIVVISCYFVCLYMVLGTPKGVLRSFFGHLKVIRVSLYGAWYR